MIDKIRIENFKSIQELEIELGRFNIFIGENGCGKSNILEAIAFGAAASSGKLDGEFLSNRGIRNSDSKFMRSAFASSNLSKPVQLSFLIDEFAYNCELANDNQPYSKWKNVSDSDSIKFPNELSNLLFNDKKQKTVHPELEEIRNVLEELFTTVGKLANSEKERKNVKKEIRTTLKDKLQEVVLDELSNFVIYSPEESSLRSFEKEGQIEPLGRRGEGLFKLLKIYSDSKSKRKSRLIEIKEQLKLIDWFLDLKLTDNEVTKEKYLHVRDRFVSEDLEFLDHRSTNEGFLFLLFYVTLMVSSETPEFFAIDNIETGLNPKLCYKLTTVLNSLSKKYKKQVILTTHNPSILDGIDLKKPDQRLFMVYRNKLGHTKYRRIMYEKDVNDENIKLSEAFLKGYIGGLSKAF